MPASGVGAEVDDDLAVVLVGVDVMEGETGIGLKAAGRLAGGAVHQREACAELGLPAVVLDVGPPGQRQRQGIDHKRELGEHQPALGEPEGVHVRGLLHWQRGDHAGLALVRSDAKKR